MSPRLRKAEDADVFAAMVRVMMRVGPAELTLSAIAKEAGITAGALVQRFGSKRELMLAHARYAAATLDIGFGTPGKRTKSALAAILDGAEEYAKLAQSPRAALRNLAYLQRDLADSALRRNLLRLHQAARAYYEQLVADAIGAGDLLAETDVPGLARTIEVTLVGSLLAWTLYRQGPALNWLSADLVAVLRPHLTDSARESRLAGAFAPGNVSST
jgi:AcrR family transcriptional regulator